MSKKNEDTRPFHLKQFSLYHHRSTMKVGTDSMILGVWTSVENVQSILEVGTGCGIISLLLASRCPAHIDAIDMDRESVDEADGNFKNSPFKDQLTALNMDFNNFPYSESMKYDLIISNPPFFINDRRPEDKKRKIARHSDHLTYDQLCGNAAKLLNENGKLAVVLPYDESRILINTARLYNLFPSRKMYIFPKEAALPNRINIEFSFKKDIKAEEEKLTIRENDNQFTQQFIDLLKDYYINLD